MIRMNQKDLEDVIIDLLLFNDLQKARTSVSVIHPIVKPRLLILKQLHCIASVQLLFITH